MDVCSLFLLQCIKSKDLKIDYKPDEHANPQYYLQNFHYPVKYYTKQENPIEKYNTIE